MRCCKVLIVQLQEESLNLQEESLDALSLVDATVIALEKIRNVENVDNQVRAAVAMTKQYGMDPIDDFQRVHRKRMTPVRFDNHSERGVNLGFTEFFRKKSLDIIDQIMIDCKENWRQVLLKIKPFSIMLPLFNISLMKFYLRIY